MIRLVKSSKPRIFLLITLLIIVILTFMFLIPVATDKNAYKALDNRFDNEEVPGICVGVGWRAEDKAAYPLGTSFHLLKGELDNYKQAIDTIKNTYAGQPGCDDNLPWYKLYL